MVLKVKKMLKRSLILFCFVSMPLVADDHDICSTNTDAISMPASTPTSQFERNGEVVTDLKTNLMWSRCPWTYTWDASNTTCIGDVVTGRMNWKSALTIANDNNSSGTPHLEYTDWRLPNIKELASIVERKCDNFGINQVVFGEAGNGTDWSNTHVYKTTDIRVVNFRSLFVGLTRLDRNILDKKGA